ncbi:hypothetical protein D1822_08365 [Phaeobacter inhibens]|nr:hypothetical protein D1822_08365 [Phaeobacter inhibens]
MGGPVLRQRKGRNGGACSGHSAASSQVLQGGLVFVSQAVTRLDTLHLGANEKDAPEGAPY